MIPTDWKQKSRSELEKLLEEKREAARAFTFGLSGSKTTNVKQGRLLRREIAQLLTLLAQQL